MRSLGGDLVWFLRLRWGGWLKENYSFQGKPVESRVEWLDEEQIGKITLAAGSIQSSIKVTSNQNSMDSTLQCIETHPRYPLK